MGYSQKQSQSENDPDHTLIIGREQIAATNKDNLSTMADGNFLLFGDNNGSISAAAKQQVKGHCILMTQRTWRVQRTGNIIDNQSVQVKIKINHISWGQALSTTTTDYYLMIDRNGDGDYHDPNDQIVPASALDGNYAVFNDIKWDNDLSGTDQFTIAAKSGVPCGIITNPNIYQRVN